MKGEMIWWVAFGVLGTLIAGLLTNFQFDTIEFQVHDTYYVLESVIVVFLVIIALGLCRYVYKFTSILASRFRGVALFISIVNPLVAGIIAFVIYKNIKSIYDYQKSSSAVDFTSQYAFLGIFLTIVFLQIIVEVEMIKRLWRN